MHFGNYLGEFFGFKAKDRSVMSSILHNFFHYVEKDAVLHSTTKKCIPTSFLYKEIHSTKEKHALLCSTTAYYTLLQATTLYYTLPQPTTLFYREIRSTTCYYTLLERNTLYCKEIRSTTGYYALLQRNTLY